MRKPLPERFGGLNLIEDKRQLAPCDRDSSHSWRSNAALACRYLRPLRDLTIAIKAQPPLFATKFPILFRSFQKINYTVWPQATPENR